MSTTNQFALLKKRRFLPFFITQFLGALNDNVFKNSLLLLLVYQVTAGASEQAGNSALLINLAAGFFIVPFFLFSAFAGQLADKYDKARLIRYIKAAEVIIMSLSVFAFVYEQTVVLLGLLFLMGTHSAFFGPIKYALIPQQVDDNELIGANALVEMGTFLAILLGTLLAGVLAPLPYATSWVSAVIVLIAVLGLISAWFIPAIPGNPVLPLNRNLVGQTVETITHATENRSVWLSLLGISWFWFLGAGYLTQFPAFAKDALFADQSVVTLLLCLFSIGVALGSLLCERLSGHQVEIGLVPLGALGLSVSGGLLYLFSRDFPVLAPDALWHASRFVMAPQGVCVLVSLLLLGLSGGLYIVPLYAMLQTRSRPDERARTMAANNIMNALFMVGSAVMGAVLLGVFHLSIPVFFLLLALVNIGVAVAIYRLIPEFTLRFVAWCLTHTTYRVRHIGEEQIPADGAAVLVCNHVSYIDAFLLATSTRRSVRFVMYKPIYDHKLLGAFFRVIGAIPICSQHEDPVAYTQAFEQISAVLRAGELLCIFPEGKLTRTGEMNEFKTGIERILARDPVPVVPMALAGLWGSFFSHKDNAVFRKPFRRFRADITMTVGSVIPAEEAKAAVLFQAVAALRGPQR